MRYFKLIYNYEKDENYINCDSVTTGSMNEYITISGKEIEQWDEVVFEYNSTEGYILTDYLANLYRWFLVSDNFRQSTRNIIKNQVQYLPVKVIDRVTRSEISSYFVANIIVLVDALDTENSKYDIFELDDEKIMSVEKYALKHNEIEGKHIFRLKDDTIPIFVSDDLKRVIENNNLSGFEFLEVLVT